MQLLSIPLTPHELRVRAMMAAFGQHCPERPGTPPYIIRRLRVRLLLEEVIEFANDSGVQISPTLETLVDSHGVYRLDDVSQFTFNEVGPGNLVKMIDALSDISVVSTGAFIACGTKMTPCLELVDSNNLLKVAGGHVDPETKKFIKPANHPVPDFAFVLKQQGWMPEPPVVASR